MDQYFDDIQISDKGMIKLIRNEGKNYIFPASNIIRIYGVKPYEDPGSWVSVVVTIICALTGRTLQEDLTVGLETNDGDLHVRVILTDDLEKRIKRARSYSNDRAKEKYGVFR
ncbi:hypothetical protein [Kosakonia sp. S42]|uniref:hypothetical protein n=1 Tax=Kosakonia sp. S42 TaxID=2767458 RepID=UPI00190DFA8E|nr:hypothetical protein [Kosakonia sp. S42]MBK0018899.1 hypothetical protein [Kosakonia sp. S42]